MRATVSLLLVLASACDRAPARSESAPVAAGSGDVAVAVPASGSVTGSGSGSGSVAGSGSVTGSGSGSGSGETFDPAEWVPVIGRWTFDHGELVSDGRVMSSLIYRKGARPRDFDFTVEVQFARTESSAGIVFREVGDDFQSDATFYQFEWYTHGSHHDRRLSFMKKNPYWVQLVEPQYPDAPLGVWIRMRVRVEGDFVQTFVDDDAVFAKHDTTFVREGRIGLHCFMPRSVRFRRPVLRVW